MKIYLKDLDGALIEVTDVNEAIRQVAGYINYLHQNHPIELQEFAKNARGIGKTYFKS
ncbi:hypothetical protein [Pedobacter sp. GR22-6]|uniref:hypothetical protein n=1 Tax=Pedobacter sp. GR22-6 TaxID=3127957 RepID=UPI00307D4C31